MLSRYLKRNISKFRSRLKKKKKRIFRVNEQLVISIKIRQKFIFFKNITIFLVELKLKFLYLNERTLTKLFNGDTIYLFFLNVSFLRCTTIQLKRGIRFRDRIILLSEFAAQKLCIFLAYISRQELELDPCEEKSFTAE